MDHVNVSFSSHSIFPLKSAHLFVNNQNSQEYNILSKILFHSKYCVSWMMMSSTANSRGFRKSYSFSDIQMHIRRFRMKRKGKLMQKMHFSCFQIGKKIKCIAINFCVYLFINIKIEILMLLLCVCILF